MSVLPYLSPNLRAVLDGLTPDEKEVLWGYLRLNYYAQQASQPMPSGLLLLTQAAQAAYETAYQEDGESWRSLDPSELYRRFSAYARRAGIAAFTSDDHDPHTEAAHAVNALWMFLDRLDALIAEGYVPFLKGAPDA